MLSVEQLLKVETEDEALDRMLKLLKRLGFPAASWQSGSLARTLVELSAACWADASQTIVTITKGRYNDDAERDFLTLLADSFYDNQRQQAVRTILNVTLHDTGNAGPFAIQAGQVVIADAGGRQYRNSLDASSTLTLGGSRSVRFVAEVAGQASTGATPLSFVTPLAGVTMPDEEVAVLTAGADAESDAKLRTRNRTKWASLAYAAPADAYRMWALEARTAITRATVLDNRRGPGTVDVYIAGATGFLPPEEADYVLAYLNGGIDGITRRPLGANVQVQSAQNVDVTVRGTVTVASGYDPSAVLAAVRASLESYFAGLDIGGALDAADNGYVMLAQLYRAVMVVPGVVNFFLDEPHGDVRIEQRYHVAIPNITLSSVDL